MHHRQTDDRMICVLQFAAAISQNVERMTGSPVSVQITRVVAGSVVASTQVIFLDGNTTSASTYQSVMTSGDTSSIFGSSFGEVTVDASFVKSATVSNPSKACQSGHALFTGIIALTKYGRHTVGDFQCLSAASACLVARMTTLLPFQW